MKKRLTERIMKTRYIILSGLIAAMSLSACEDVIDVKLDNGETLLVVDGYVNDDTTRNYTVTLSTTAPYFDGKATPRVSGAFVEITEWNSLGQQTAVDTLQEQVPGSGNYISAKLKGRTGNTYQLIVRALGQEYRAETEIRRIPEIDSLTFEYREKSIMSDAGYIGKYSGPELVGVGDYYRLVVYRNGEMLNKPFDLSYVSDEMVDGKYIGNLEINFEPFQKGDVIRAEMRTITRDQFYFFAELGAQVVNGGLFANPPANVRTNLKNTSPGGKPAVGYFGGYGMRAITRVAE